MGKWWDTKSIFRNQWPFFCTNNEISEIENWKKVPFTIATRKIKYLLMNKLNHGGKRSVLGKLQNTEARN